MREGWDENQIDAWLQYQIDDSRNDCNNRFKGCWYDLPAFVRHLYEDYAYREVHK